MAAPRIVFADMDDTFLSTDKTVCRENLELLDRLAEKGVPFVPCTGRTWRALPAEVLLHPATRYAVTSDGAVVMELLRDVAVQAASPDAAGEVDVELECVGQDRSAVLARRLCLRAMGKERTLALYDRLEGVPCTFDVFWGGRVFVERWRYDLISTFDIRPDEKRAILRHRTPVDAFVPELVEHLGGVERVSLYWGNDALTPDILSAVDADETLHHTHSSARNLEVMDVRTSKGAGLEWLCAHLGIDPAQAIAFGDSPNDLSMLRAAGSGIAMLNAYDEAKAVADRVTAYDNDHAGVARHLRGLL
ncbi:HAD family hydrolase [Parafannyhessea umbonata]|uniref:Uncharacterized protein n=1 Tax=Parafannyhessea umbonata TaxID=604330 RepID=A0A1H9N726_9ACTN|nr:HAD family hydrolase [Parafannyhessea umbonata]SER31621.1 hypothetical protein SAMN05216446_0244 [Parafannyhessea umbonata]